MKHIAQKLINKSTIKIKVVAILVDKRTKKIVATGRNHFGNGGRNGTRTVHAEIDALKKVVKPSPNLVMYLYREGCRPIHPCKSCMEVLKAYQIPEIRLFTGCELNNFNKGD